VLADEPLGMRAVGGGQDVGARGSDRAGATEVHVRGAVQHPATAPAGQTGKQAELFAVYRYHAVFTDSAEPTLAAEATHRDHAILEQVIAELKNGPLAHLPSGVFINHARGRPDRSPGSTLRGRVIDYSTSTAVYAVLRT
jgi:hypothetical protein